MPAAGTQALLSIRSGGQRLAAREVLAGRDRLERLAPDRGERLAARLPAWDRSSRRPSAAVHVLSAHRAAEDRDARTYRGRRRLPDLSGDLHAIFCHGLDVCCGHIMNWTA